MKLNLNKTQCFTIICILSLVLVETLAFPPLITYDNDGLLFSNSFMFPNGDILYRFYRKIDDNCNEPNLHLKLLHKNGTLRNFDIENLSDVSIPRKNFCFDYSSNGVDSIEVINYGLVNSYNFYVLYYNMSESDPTAPFDRFYLEIHSEGKILR